MDNFVLILIAKYGYFGMFIAMVLEAVIIIIPSELVLATGGILASRGIFTFYNAFFIGLFGSVFCAIILYIIGRYGGNSFIDKFGKYFFMKKSDIKKSEDWFNRYGMFACFIGRNFPIVRTFISIPIGIHKLNFFKFLIYTTLGSIPWTFLFVYFGYKLGDSWIIISKYIDKLKIPIYILIGLLIIKYISGIIKKR